MDRSKRADTRFTPTDAEMIHIARICRLVDGMPPGLEIAASWVRTLTCQQNHAAWERGTQMDLVTVPALVDGSPQMAR